MSRDIPHHTLQIMAAGERQLCRDMPRGTPQPSLDHIDGFLGHPPKSRQFPAQNRYQTVLMLDQFVGARQLRRGLHHPSTNERTVSGIGTDHVATGQCRVEVLVGMVEQILDVLVLRQRALEWP
ncbi:hypothetical protein HRbin27_01664 [bacterium HR27]|nr:hypothetical protein HRbin27_01664 [bacterium HR27]